MTPLDLTYVKAFISYNSQDADFADRLYRDLKSKGVRVWQDKHELLPRDLLDESLFGPKGAVRKSEKLLLVCSRNSLSPENLSWVNREVSEAMAMEREHLTKTGESLKFIIPIDIDGFLFSDDCHYSRRQDLRDRVAARFWSEHDVDPYDKQLSKVLKALRANRVPGTFDWGG